MKWSFATVGVIILGLMGISIILLFQSVTTNNENDYYLLKEVTEAAMIDAIDIPYYRETGELKIVREKFVENFTRRYAESTIFVSSEYTITFYEIMETPPKVSIIIDTGLGTFTVAGNSDEYNIQNKLDAILEYTGSNTYEIPGDPTIYNDSNSGVNYENLYTSKDITKTYYALVKTDSPIFNHSLRLPSELIAPNISDVKIKEKPVFAEKVKNQAELNEALLKRELSFYNFDDGNLLNGTDPTNYMDLISNYETNIKENNVKLSFYNCISKENNCNETNKYFVKGEIQNLNTDKDKILVKYNVTWSYREYLFKLEEK